MFKKVIAILLIITTFLSFSGFSSKKKQEVDLSTPEAKIANSVLEYPATNEDFRYDVYTYYIAITECLSSKSNIIIPDTIQDLPVYKINKDAFKDQVSVTSITMTNNVIEIGESAFKKCINLESITLSKNLKTCGKSAFEGCQNLKAAIVPSTLIIIPPNMFSDCERLSAVIIEENNNITASAVGDENGRAISSNAFSKCPLLKNIWIPMEVTIIESNSFNRSTENITLYGQAQSAAAHFASQNLLNFNVLSKSDFANILNNATMIENLTLNDSIESYQWKITFDKVISISGSFGFESGEYIKQRETKTENEVVILCFSVKNVSSTSAYFNHLDLNVKSGGYIRKISTFGTIQSSKLGLYNQPLVGKIEAGDTLHGYIAVELPGDWKDVSVQFMNETSLESYAFVTKSLDESIARIDNTPQEPTEDTSNITEDTSETTEETTIEKYETQSVTSQPFTE